jgi:hypothetical protein
MWTIRKYTTTITKARILPTGKDPTTGLNHGHLSITQRTDMESMAITDAKGKSITRMDGRIHLITMRRMTTCGNDTVQARLPVISSPCAYAYMMELWVFSHYIRIGVWFTSVLSVFRERGGS